MPLTRYLIFVLLLVAGGVAGCASSALRQRPEKTFRVSGYVLDSVSRKPVAGVFVNAYDRDNYFGLPQTDKRGHFVLKLPVSDRSRLTHLTVNTVLYEGSAAIPTDTASEVLLLLRRNAKPLPASACTAGLPDTLRMKPYASQANPMPGCELAFLLKNSSTQGTDTVRSLSLDVNRLGISQGDSEVFYVLKAYLPNGPEQGPGTDVMPDWSPRLVLSRSMALSPAGKKGLFTFDLSEYHIPVPPQGVFISLYRIVVEGWRPGLECLNNYTPSGALLRPACNLTENNVWVQTYRKGWCPIPPAENPVPLYHEAVRVELLSRK